MTSCNNCKTDRSNLEVFCGLCNYPIQGTKKEQAVFISTQVMQRSDVNEAFTRLKRARILLFVIAGLYGLTGIYLFLNEVTEIAISNMVITALFLGFGFLSFKMPKLALAIPLILVVVYYLLLLFIDPILVWQGFVWKIFTIGVLSYALYSVWNADSILNANPYLASLLGINKISD